MNKNVKGSKSLILSEEEQKPLVFTYFEEKQTFHKIISLLQRVGDQKAQKRK